LIPGDRFPRSLEALLRPTFANKVSKRGELLAAALRYRSNCQQKVMPQGDRLAAFLLN